MSKRTLALALTGALFMLGLQLSAASAAPEVPEEPNVVDPVGDANYINDQGLTTSPMGNVSTPADVGSVSDIMAVWFSNDAENISAHVQTEVPGPATTAVMFRVRVNPEDGVGCLWFEARLTGAGNTATENGGRIRDLCGGGDTITPDGVTVTIDEVDGTGVLTITAPRSISPMFDEGAVLAAPSAETRNLSPAATAPQIDNTELGTDYAITSGGGEPEPEPEPDPGTGPTEPKDPGNKKACKKKNKNQPKKGCDAYVPGELGAEAETIVLTDAATAEEPVIQEVELDQYFFEGITGTPPSKVLNVQVDSAAATAGLYATFSFPARRDYDLWAYWPSGAEAASSHGFNPLVEAQTPAPLPDLSNTRNNHAGESHADSENLIGVITPDCGGYTLEMTNYFGEGGTLELSLWLGEGTNEPKPESES